MKDRESCANILKQKCIVRQQAMQPEMAKLKEKEKYR
jgi:hypothetical protein